MAGYLAKGDVVSALVAAARDWRRFRRAMEFLGFAEQEIRQAWKRSPAHIDAEACLANFRPYAEFIPPHVEHVINGVRAILCRSFRRFVLPAFRQYMLWELVNAPENLYFDIPQAQDDDVGVLVFNRGEVFDVQMPEGYDEPPWPYAHFDGVTIWFSITVRGPAGLDDWDEPWGSAERQNEWLAFCEEQLRARFGRQFANIEAGETGGGGGLLEFNFGVTGRRRRGQ